jgi:hypothetical protein
MANACIPPASTIAGLLLEQTDRTETKLYYKHYAVTAKTMAQHMCNNVEDIVILHFRQITPFLNPTFFRPFIINHIFRILLNDTNIGPSFLPTTYLVYPFCLCVTSTSYLAYGTTYSIYKLFHFMATFKCQILDYSQKKRELYAHPIVYTGFLIPSLTRVSCEI